MVKPIIKSPGFLAKKSAMVTGSEKDKQIAGDLVDTLLAHRDECVGLAANMIGWLKRIIVVDMGFAPMVMYNPVITMKEGPFETEEGCLCHEGEKKVLRYARIEVTYQDHAFQPRKQIFTGYIAEIIQHEIDHCNGILI